MRLLLLTDEHVAEGEAPRQLCEFGSGLELLESREGRLGPRDSFLHPSLLPLDCCEPAGDAGRRTNVAFAFVERNRVAEQSLCGLPIGRVQAFPSRSVEKGCSFRRRISQRRRLL